MMTGLFQKLERGLGLTKSEFGSVVIEDWSQNDYYDLYFKPAESKRWMETFWGPQSIFLKRFSHLSTDRILELACGMGRHTEILSKKCNEVIAVDVSKANVDYTKRRLVDKKNVKVYKNDGLILSMVPDSYLDSIISYDSMVHFEDFVVFYYLREFSRILKNNGKILIHHSNFSYKEASNCHYHNNPSWRNPLDINELNSSLNELGFKIISQDFLEWDDIENLDCLTLAEKS
jgi:SAM-dependent methyltransferase